METPDYILDLEGEIFITLKYPNCEFVPCEQEGPQKVSSEVVDHELLQRWMGMAIDAGIMDEKYKKLTTVPFVVEPDDDEIQAIELESGIWGIGGPPVDILPSSLLTAEERISRRRARDELEKKMLQLMSDERRLSTTAECWDEDALLYVLEIIHCQHHELPDKVDLEMLGKVCVVADYYDVHDAVRFAARPWIAKLDPQGPDDSYRESVIWLWIGIFFRMPGVFKAASLALIKEGKTHMPPLGLPIPAPIVEEINARRIKAIEGLMDHIYHVEDEYLSGKRGCSFECSSMLYGTLMKNMSVYGLSRSEFMAPFTHNSYTSLANLIDRFRQPRWYDPRSSKYLCWQYLEHECHDAHFWEIRAGRFLDDEGLELKDFIKMD
ncbi:hypothetical protein M752DRAFT_305970 [Aspergillus phoenicis ATCC 13157]|uniref:Uncharacterized protein n=1 Tax=Aspergillus phoenicis ATCC 13157 TaxID=1353007 RepID=A0A370PWZ3_ASPPH|nr:hypothetical protein M752DRAFT_305970 [Aspergillus phoenicis ATCC 13157]